MKKWYEDDYELAMEDEGMAYDDEIEDGELGYPPEDMEPAYDIEMDFNPYTGEYDYEPDLSF